MRQTHQLGGQQQDISQKNTIQPKLIGDFFEKFHFSLVVARLSGTLVEGIKNRKAIEILVIDNDLRYERSEPEILKKYVSTLADWRFFEKFHFSHVVARLADPLIYEIKNRKANKILRDPKRFTQ